MRLSQRQKVILGEIQGGDYVEVKDLAARLDVDVSTIRRDLQTLVRNDLVVRLHGGVRLRSEEDESPDRSAGADEHLAIAGTARRMIRSGDSLMLGSGPCVDHLCTLLLDLEDVTVITADLRAAVMLGRHRQLRVLVPGGELRDGPGSSVVSGPQAAAFLETQRPDWLFLEVEGVHPYAGFTTSATWQVSSYRAMLKAARRRCILAPSHAFGVRCVGFIADTREGDLIITDEKLDDADLPAFGGRVVRGATDPIDEWRADGEGPGWWAGRRPR